MLTLNSPLRPLARSVQAVIFDWAGTTVDHGSIAPVMSFIETFRRHGVEISIAEARAPMGLHKLDHIRAITQMPAVAAYWQAVHGRCPDEGDVATMYQDFIPLQLQVIGDYAQLIPGTLATMHELRRRGIKIGSTTGYNWQMMDVLAPAAARLGFVPDSIVCVSDVPAGRPEPWMALRSAMDLRVYPPATIVKVGDTAPDIAEGLNAGMWTVGITLTGNELGLSRADLEALQPSELAARNEQAHLRLAEAGAHYVVDGIWDLPDVLEAIDRRLDERELP